MQQMNPYLQQALMQRQGAYGMSQQGMMPQGQSPMMGGQQSPMMSQQQPPQQSSMMGATSAPMGTSSALPSPFPTMGETIGGTIPGMGAIAGGFLSVNPAEEAMKYASTLGEAVAPYFDPYIEAGLGALDILYDEYGNLITDPNQIYNKLAAGFEASPGYEYNYNQAMNASNSAAAAGGMLGSPAHTQQSQEMATQLANQDYYNYLDRMMSLYSTGLGGMGEINQMGYGASNQMAAYMAQQIMAEAYLAAMAAKFQNAQTGSMLGGIADVGMALMSPSSILF